MEHSPSPPGTDGPDWVRESVRVTRDELHRFVTTALGLMLHPAPARPGRAAAALTVAVVVSALVLGALHRRARFGLGVPHFTLIWSGRTLIPDIWF